MEVKGITQPIFGNWYIEEELGAGSFGTVYKIYREDFGKRYYSALKVIKIPQTQAELRSIRYEFPDDKSLGDYYDNFVKDFAKEIEVMAELKGNSNIVSFEDHAFLKNEDGIGWTILIRMELLTPFMEYQAIHPLTKQDILKLGVDMCTALDVCEKRKIIHRDIKPDNIFITHDGDYKLGDFGISRELEKTTGGLSKKGTYSYMAPEVYTGKAYNSTVDIYSLGIVLYRLFNHNRAPFMPPAPEPITMSAREEAFKRRITGVPIPDLPSQSDAVNRMLKKACAYQPRERYQNAGEMKQALLELLHADNVSKSSIHTMHAQPDSIVQHRSEAEKANSVNLSEEEPEKTASVFSEAQKGVEKKDRVEIYEKTSSSTSISGDLDIKENDNNNFSKNFIFLKLFTAVTIFFMIFNTYSFIHQDINWVQNDVYNTLGQDEYSFIYDVYTGIHVVMVAALFCGIVALILNCVKRENKKIKICCIVFITISILLDITACLIILNNIIAGYWASVSPKIIGIVLMCVVLLCCIGARKYGVSKLSNFALKMVIVFAFFINQVINMVSYI